MEQLIDVKLATEIIKKNCDELIAIKRIHDPKDLFGYDFGIPLDCSSYHH